MYVFLNGQIVKNEDAKISINDLSYQFGYGLFETIKCLDGNLLFFQNHYKRLIRSAKELGMELPIKETEIKDWIIDTLKTNKLSTARVKLIISKRIEESGEKFNVLIIPFTVDILPVAYTLISKKFSWSQDSITYRHKTTSRADHHFFYTQAISEGFNDAVFINEKNELLECTRANVFLVLEDKIVTPKLETGILPGITREVTINALKKNGFQLEEKDVHSLYLNKAKEVFITNSIIGVMPISRFKTNEKDYYYSNFEITNKVKILYTSLYQTPV